MRIATLLATLVMAISIVGVASGQQKPDSTAGVPLAGYDVRREITLVGTVQSFTLSAQKPPLGPHVLLQTASGIIDVHLGNAQLLAANHFSLQEGDTLRIIGENLAYATGTQFVARIVQKGTQALEVRSIRGIPLSYMPPRGAAQSKPPGGVL